MGRALTHSQTEGMPEAFNIGIIGDRDREVLLSEGYPGGTICEGLEIQIGPPTCVRQEFQKFSRSQ